MTNIIAVCGMNGAGKSTLGKQLAKEINYQFIDNEDLYFPKENPDYLYSSPRSSEEVEALLSDIISKGKNFVFASVRPNFKPEIISYIKCVIHIEVPKEIRHQRVYDRSYKKFGERIKPGGDLYEKEQGFFEFVKSRDENTVKNWLATMSRPVITIDGTLPVTDNVNLIVENLKLYKE